MLVVASRLRSLIAGVSAITVSTEVEGDEMRLGRNHFAGGVLRLSKARRAALPRCGLWPRNGVVPFWAFLNERIRASSAADRALDRLFGSKPLGLSLCDPAGQVSAPFQRLGKRRATAKPVRRSQFAVERLLLSG